MHVVSSVGKEKVYNKERDREREGGRERERRDKNFNVPEIHQFKGFILF